MNSREISKDFVKHAGQIMFGSAAPKAPGPETITISKSEYHRLKSGYHFTPEQLQEHDRFVMSKAVEQADKNIQSRAKKYIDEEFVSREKFFAGNHGDAILEIVALTITVPLLVLVRDLGFPIVTRYTNSRSRTARFCDGVKAELQRILTDEMIDIRQYAAMVQDYTGVSFDVSDPFGGEDESTDK